MNARCEKRKWKKTGVWCERHLWSLDGAPRFPAHLVLRIGIGSFSKWFGGACVSTFPQSDRCFSADTNVLVAERREQRSRARSCILATSALNFAGRAPDYRRICAGCRRIRAGLRPDPRGLPPYLRACKEKLNAWFYRFTHRGLYYCRDLLRHDACYRGVYLQRTFLGGGISLSRGVGSSLRDHSIFHPM